MWQCPVCEQDIDHRRDELFPARRGIYRCAFCRIDLIFDEDYARFKLAPLADETARQKKKPSARKRR